MKVQLAMFDGRAVGAELPQRVVLEITETEPAVRGQTATASYKPATLSNGVRIQVPQHITPGTKVVVNTADGTYLERSKD
jgi:elongation factor P